MPVGIPTHYEYAARKVCVELGRIEAPTHMKSDIIRIAARKAVEVTFRNDKKMAYIMWNEIKRYFPDIVTDVDKPNCL